MAGRKEGVTKASLIPAERVAQAIVLVRRQRVLLDRDLEVVSVQAFRARNLAQDGVR